jgi:hypothetical protein
VSNAILTNLTPFVAGHFVLPDGEGGEQLLVIVKATLDVAEHGALVIAEPGVELRMVDEFRGKPELGIPLHDCDLVPPKPRVDVLLDAVAHAPDGEPIDRVMVELRVGSIVKQALVSGDRIWIDDEPSEPEPFTSMPLVWERAFGGTRSREVVDERNPVGIGHAGARSGDPQVLSLLPNIEDPKAPMLHPQSTCAPVGFAAVGRAWLPRRPLAGTFDVAWKRDRWPLAPRDFDPAFHQSAPLDQQLDEFEGGERVRLVNLTPEGEWSFRLPQLDVPIHFVYPDRLAHAPCRVDTVEIEAEQRRVVLTGRVAIPIERQRPGLREIIVGHAKPAWLKAKQSGKCHLDLRGEKGIDTSRGHLR